MKHSRLRYQKYPCRPELAPFVECYFVWEGSAPEELIIQTPPNCKGAIVFNYGDPARAQHHDADPIPVPDAFACGQFTANFQRILHGTIGMTGIVFKPTGIHNFFGTRMSSLVNSRMPLELLIGDEATALISGIKTGGESERISLLERFLLNHLTAAKSRLSIIDEVADYLDEKKGLVAVDEVAGKFKVSTRYLEKHFQMKVGISPKLYSRLKRFVILSLELAYENNSDWQDLIEKAGLHDQSHLIREFMEFDKTTPARYFKTHREITRHIKPQ